MLLPDAAGPDRWFPIALSQDVEAGATRAVILDGIELVAWRGADGEVRVWNDRCPHRGMRLSFGFVRGNVLNCLYHGWQYGGTGQCVKIPAHADLTVPPTIRTTSYAVCEADGVVWVNTATEATGEPPALGEGLAGVASTAVERASTDIADAPSFEWSSDGVTLTVGVHPVSGTRAMLHALARHDAGTDLVALRLAAARSLRRLRRALETDAPRVMARG